MSSWPAFLLPQLASQILDLIRKQIIGAVVNPAIPIPQAFNLIVELIGPH